MFIPKSKKCAKACAAVSLSAVMLFSTSSLASAASLLKLGSSGSEVREVQSRLKDLGYFKYPSLTGYYGNITRDAVKDFQASKGIAQDGIVGNNTRKHLFETSTSNSSIQVSNALLKRGSRGSAVSQLQQLLKDKGYLKGLVDGIFGNQTYLAVTSFQQTSGLTVDGIVGSKTWEALGSASFTSRGSSKQDNKISTSLIKKGSRGSAVTQLQQQLKNKGYLKGAVDGIFGDQTYSAVRSFQKDAGLAVDGIVGSKTWQALGSETSSSRGSGASDNINSRSLLKVGSRGSAVSNLQERLKSLGYLTGKVDGTFGSQTQKAVISFQKDNGLAADGIVGAKTITKLNNPTSSRGDNKGRPATPETKTGNEMVAWSDVDKLWPRGTYATIIDYDTGKSFKVMRSGGYNHADVETATAADTAILKGLYGGSFSWNRRAVVVEVAGRSIAASMAGMPHAGRDDKPNRAMVHDRSGGYGYGQNLDAVKGNDMDGVFDVHFYGSKTHGTNRVDSQHQAQIKRAAGK